MGTPTHGEFSPEVRERAIRLILEQAGQYPSQWAAISAIAPKLGTTKETLRRWIRRVERDEGQRPGLTSSDAQRLKELEREVKELRRANESSARRARVSRRRSSTAAVRDVRVHRRASRRVWSRADLRGARGRSLGLLRPPHDRHRSHAPVGPRAARCGAAARHSCRVDRGTVGVRGDEDLEGARATRPRRGPLHRRAACRAT